MIDFNKKMYHKDRLELVEVLNDLQRKFDFRVSARGWCYEMLGRGYIDKSQFSKVEEAIGKCRKEGLLPVDFVATDDARAFAGVETPSDETMKELLSRMLYDVLHGTRHFTPDWLEGVDAVTRFEAKRQAIQDKYQDELEQLGIVEIDDLERAIDQLDIEN